MLAALRRANAKRYSQSEPPISDEALLQSLIERDCEFVEKELESTSAHDRLHFKLIIYSIKLHYLARKYQEDFVKSLTAQNYLCNDVTRARARCSLTIKEGQRLPPNLPTARRCRGEACINLEVSLL